MSLIPVPHRSRSMGSMASNYVAARSMTESASHGRGTDDSSTLSSGRPQFRPQPAHPIVRPRTAYDSAGTVSHNNRRGLQSEYGYISSQAGDSNYLTPSGPANSPLLAINNMVTPEKAARLASEDGYFAPLDPNKPPESWTFTSTAENASVSLAPSRIRDSVDLGMNRKSFAPTYGESLDAGSRAEYSAAAMGMSTPGLYVDTPVNLGRTTPKAVSVAGRVDTNTVATGHTGHTARTGRSKYTAGTGITDMTAKEIAMAARQEAEDAAVQQRARFERDYRVDERIRFLTDVFPAELEGRVSPSELQETLESLNSLIASGESGALSGAWSHCFAFLTLYTTLCCFQPRYEQAIDRAAVFLEEENKRLYLGRGLRWRDPRETAFLHLELIFT